MENVLDRNDNPYEQRECNCGVCDFCLKFIEKNEIDITDTEKERGE